jgi:hypothetical protein
VGASQSVISWARLAGQEDLFSTIRTDKELSELVRGTSAAHGKPYTVLLGSLIGTAPDLGEDVARAYWLATVDHRRVLSARLGRLVLLRVAALDLFSLESKATVTRPPRAAVRRTGATARKEGVQPGIAVYATRIGQRLLSLQRLLASSGILTLPAPTLRVARLLARLAAPQMLVVDVRFPPNGGAPLLAGTPPSCRGVLVVPGQWTGAIEKTGQGLLRFPFAREAVAAEVAKAQLKTRARVPLFRDLDEASAVAGALMALAAGRVLADTPAVARPEVDLVSRLLGA